MLELTGITKAFKGQTVLKGIDLRICSGELIVIRGASGSGKSTLLDIAAGILKPDAGTRNCDMQRIAYAFQSDCLIPWQSVRENISIAAGSFLSVEELQSRIDELLMLLGLSSSETLKPLELSGGMKKRLNIARAFAIQPDLLLLDEPFAFQDSEGIQVLSGLIEKERRRGTAVMIASHGVLPPVGTSDRVLVLDKQE